MLQLHYFLEEIHLTKKKNVSLVTTLTDCSTKKNASLYWPLFWSTKRGSFINKATSFFFFKQDCRYKLLKSNLLCCIVAADVLLFEISDVSEIWNGFKFQNLNLFHLYTICQQMVLYSQTSDIKEFFLKEELFYKRAYLNKGSFKKESLLKAISFK